MLAFSELLKKQERAGLALRLLYDIVEIQQLPEEIEKYLFRIAEKTNPEYLVIFALRSGMLGYRYTYANIGRLLGKKRCVVRKKYLNCLQIIRGENEAKRIEIS